MSIGDDEVEALGASLSDYAGSWEGYAEAHEFDDGTDAIRLTLDAEGEGVLEVGNADPLPAPDRDQAYPPAANMSEWWEQWERNRPAVLVSGYAYPVSGASVEGRRLRADTSTREMQREWCELQTAYPVVDVAPGEFGCQPWSGWSASAETCHVRDDVESEHMEIACGKLACVGVCTCDAESCSIDDSPNVELDAALQADGDELRGSLLIGGQLVNIQLTRL